MNIREIDESSSEIVNSNKDKENYLRKQQGRLFDRIDHNDIQQMIYKNDNDDSLL